MPLIKLTSATDDHDIYVESDHITSIEPQRTGNQSFLWMLNGNGRRVKESPTAIIAAIAEAEDDPCCDCEFGPDVRFELTPLAEEMLKEAGRLYPAAKPAPTTDLILKLQTEVAEATSDAKVADERAEWFKKLAEQRLEAIKQKDAEIFRLESKAKVLDATVKAIDVKLGERERYCEEAARIIEEKRTQIAEHRHTADNLVRKLGEQAKELSEWRGGIRSVGMPWYVKPSDPAVNPKWSSTYNDFNRE